MSRLVCRRPAWTFTLLSLLILLGLADAFHPRALFQFVQVSSAAKQHGANTLLSSNRGGGGSAPPTLETQDFSPQTLSLFSNVRVPAALFAGASAASAFALPILPSDSLVVGFAKRIYALLMTGAISSELIAIVVSTTSMATLAYYKHAPTTSVDDFITENYEFEWTATLCNFIFGMLSFVFASGIRAWISIDCPIVARAALGIITSSTLLAISFLNDAYKKNGESFLQLPWSFFKLLIQAARRDFLFCVAVTFLTTTYIYIAIKTPHVYLFLSKG